MGTSGVISIVKKDLTGLSFGYLTVICELEERKNEHIVWRCRCKCGREVDVTGCNLITGNSTSCGCGSKYGSKWSHKVSKASGGRRLYEVWQNMKHRVCDPSDRYYGIYGGRGITVCEEWLNDYDAFASWALNNGYTDSLTIDRIDSDAGYSPDNCRWVDIKTQANNRRDCRYVCIDGEKMTATQAARKYGVPPPRVLGRLKRGWSDEDAVFTEKRKNQWS